MHSLKNLFSPFTLSLESPCQIGHTEGTGIPQYQLVQSFSDQQQQLFRRILYKCVIPQKFFHHQLTVYFSSKIAKWFLFTILITHDEDRMNRQVAKCCVLTREIIWRIFWRNFWRIILRLCTSTFLAFCSPSGRKCKAIIEVLDLDLLS